MRFTWVAIAMVQVFGCRQSNKPSSDDSACCDGCCVEPSTTFPDYEYLDLVEDRDIDDANWVHLAVPRVVTFDADGPSLESIVTDFFTDANLTAEEVSTTLGDFVAYWNGAGAEISLELGVLDRDCCNGADDVSACEDCLSNSTNDIFVWDGDSTEIDPDVEAAALTSPTADSSVTCVETMDVIFFTGFIDEDNGGAWCSYTWQYPYTDQDDDCDGDLIKTKAYKDTAVHELGHAIGIDHQPSHPESSVNSGCVGCNYDTIQEPDITGLVELYAQCR